jgi:hypothetical protein
MSTHTITPRRGTPPPPPPPRAKGGAPTQHAAADPAESGGIPSYGTLIQVLSTPGPPEDIFTTIEGVGDITGPSNTMAEIDVTSHSTGVPIKQTIPGLIDLGDLAFPCFWNPADPTQNINSPFGIEYLFLNRVVTKWQLIMTDPTRRTRQFYGFVKTMGEDYKISGVCTRNIAIRITSPMKDVPSPIALNPSSVAAVPATGTLTDGTFNVVVGGSNAPWMAHSSAPWIEVVTPVDTQYGDGEVTYKVLANTSGIVRSGSIIVSGVNLTFTVDQVDV